MRILHVLASNKFSGAENVVCQIIDMFKDTPDIEMAYCSPDGDIREILAKHNIKFIPLKKLNKSNLKSAIKEFAPDIIHAHDFRASFIAANSAKKITIISHIHNNAFASRRVSIKSLAFLWAIKYIKHIFWVSNSAMTDFRYKKVVAQKSSVLTNVIDIKALYAKMQEDKTIYSYDIVFIGRLTYPKNPQRFLQIIELVKQQKCDIKVAIIGTGELETAIRQLANDKGLLHNIDFLGFQKNPLKILYNSKVMLMTSRWEGLPMCALEAMSLGVPIVSTPVDGLKDIIINNKTGYMSNSDLELCDALIKILNNDSLQEEMSHNSIIKAETINDLVKYKKALLEQYL